jgi:ATP-dependent helicase/nuclease subunit B
MMAKNMNSTELFQALTEGAVALTPNRRLSRAWQKAYAQHNAQAQGVWPKPAIYPLEEWLQHLWQDLSLTTELPVVLDSAQQTWLWQQIIKDATENQFMNHTALAQTAQSAWQYLQHWQLKLSHATCQLSAETQAFYTWHSKYQQRCKQTLAIDDTQLISHLLTHWRTNASALPSRLILISFTEITPLQQTLFKQLALHCQVHAFDPEPQTCQYHLTVANDPQQELRAMAIWAKQTVSQNTTQASDPIACVVPNLTENATAVQREFADVFENQADFDLSAGQRLATHPAVDTALTLLSLPTSTTSQRLQKLLMSHYLHFTDQDPYQRAKALETLAAQGQAGSSAAHLMATLPPAIAAILRQPQALSKQPSARPSAWITALRALLDTCLWPGPQLTHEQQHVQQQFYMCLDQLAKLDVLTPHISYQGAIDTLSLICQQHIYHQATTTAKVHILGALEAAGLRFSAVWISGLDDSQWPPAPQLNPLLPIALQQQHNMPHSSAARELKYCRQLLASYVQHNPRVIASYAQQHQDTLQQPSRLLLQWPQVPLSSLIPLPVEHQPTQTLKTYTNNPVPLPRQDSYRGGSRIVQLQAACPFRAFAETRLGATPLDTRYIGLDALDRGLILHHCLEKIWQHLSDQAQLLAMPDRALERLCADTSAEVLCRYLLNWPKPLRATLQQLEQQRLVRLQLEWLNVEKQRPPFKVIAIEKNIQVSIDGFTFNGRVDRIDELEGQQKLIIDYKTGAASPYEWLGPRPDAPQLPLYALSEDDLVGIAFAQVKVDHCQFRGVSAIDTQIPGIQLASKLTQSASWSSLRNTWLEVFTQLLGDYQQGDATVAPKEPSTSCQYCPLPVFCRIHECS